LQRFPVVLKNCIHRIHLQETLMATIFTRRTDVQSRVESERSGRQANAFSWARAFRGAFSESGKIDGYEGEMFSEIARATGAYAGSGRVPMPLQLLADPCIKIDTLTRDLNKVNPAQGGNMVGTNMAPVAEILRPWSELINAGVTAVQTSGGDLEIPYSYRPVAAWKGSETSTVDPGDMLIKKLSLSPKSAWTMLPLSGLLHKQSEAIDALLQSQMLAAVGALLDTSIISGSGTDGEPRGIANTDGVDLQSGMFDFAKALDMEELGCETVQSSDASFGFVAAPDVRKLLKHRLADTTGGLGAIWQSHRTGDELAGRPAHVSLYAPNGSIVSGPLSDCVVAIWGVPVVEMNPYGHRWDSFRAGTKTARLILDCDVGLFTPHTWTYHSSIA